MSLTLLVSASHRGNKKEEKEKAIRAGGIQFRPLLCGKMTENEKEGKEEEDSKEEAVASAAVLSISLTHISSLQFLLFVPP